MNLWIGTVCTNCEKEHECAEAELMFKGGAIAYGCSACVPKQQTNADRIRAMTDEELAEFIGTHDCLDCPLNNEDDWCAGNAGSCRGNVLEWLKSTAKEGDNG